jgi:hypothetical protein
MPSPRAAPNSLSARLTCAIWFADQNVAAPEAGYQMSTPPTEERNVKPILGPAWFDVLLVCTDQRWTISAIEKAKLDGQY